MISASAPNRENLFPMTQQRRNAVVPEHLFPTDSSTSPKLAPNNGANLLNPPTSKNQSSQVTSSTTFWLLLIVTDMLSSIQVAVPAIQDFALRKMNSLLQLERFLLGSLELHQKSRRYLRVL